jgi:hypothetical protein
MSMPHGNRIGMFVTMSAVVMGHPIMNVMKIHVPVVTIMDRWVVNMLG